MDAMPLWLAPVFFAIAAVYAMAGFGGGSAYLAVLTLLGVPYASIPQTALLCNVIVSAGGAWHFSRGGHLDARRILPIVILSVPMAFVGGRIDVGEGAFMMLLGVSLLAAGARMFIRDRRGKSKQHAAGSTYWLVGLPVGAGLGFLSGVVGIGGGVFLAPLLMLSGWANAKQTAGAASVFVLVNSLAGLAGQFAKGVHVDRSVVPLILAAWLGGQIGSSAGSYRLPMVAVRRVLAGVLVVVSLRILWGGL